MDMLFIFNTGMQGIPIDFYIFLSCLPSRENYVMMMMMMLISQGYALRKIEGSSEF